MSKTYPFEISPHLAEYNVPLHDFIASKAEYSAFVVGAFIFLAKSAKQTDSDTNTLSSNLSDCSPNQETRVLLLQRALTDSYPGMWEGPGGSCEETDATLLDSMAREVLEESGLHVSRVLDMVDTHEWKMTRGRGTAVKYSFLVEVYEAKGSVNDNKNVDTALEVLAPDGWEHRVKLDPNEHRDYVWATEGEVKDAIAGKADKVKINIDEEGKGFLRAFQVFESLRSPSVDSSES